MSTIEQQAIKNQRYNEIIDKFYKDIDVSTTVDELLSLFNDVLNEDTYYSKELSNTFFAIRKTVVFLIALDEIRK